MSIDWQNKLTDWFLHGRNTGRYPVGIFMFKVNNRTSCEICSKLTIETPERRHWRCSSVLVSISVLVFLHLALVFLSITGKCRLGNGLAVGGLRKLCYYVFLLPVISVLEILYFLITKFNMIFSQFASNFVPIILGRSVQDRSPE